MRSQSLLIHTKHVKAATSVENNRKWMLRPGWNKLDTSWKQIIPHNMAKHRHKMQETEKKKKSMKMWGNKTTKKSLVLFGTAD